MSVNRCNPEILDVTSSFRQMWFNKNDPDTLYCDVRPHRQILKDKQTYEIRRGRKNVRATSKLILPTMAASYCYLPFKDNCFFLINADPPHLYKLGKTSLFRLKYGGLEIGVWQLEMRLMAKELWRVLAPGGSITFKWCNRDISLKEIVRLFPVKPRYGQVGSHGLSSKTFWCTFHKCREILD